MKSFDISEWLHATIAQLADVRPTLPKVSEEYLVTLLRQLSRSSFTQQQAIRAELWLLRGNWQYKPKDVALQLADFYPTFDQIEHLLADNDDLVITSRRSQRLNIEGKVQIAYSRGYQDGKKATDPRTRQESLSAIYEYYRTRTDELEAEVRALRTLLANHRKKRGIIELIPPHFYEHLAEGNEESFLEMVEWLNDEFQNVLFHEPSRKKWQKDFKRTFEKEQQPQAS